jgi:hypothetical protein
MNDQPMTEEESDPEGHDDSNTDENYAYGHLLSDY